jgi:hypothetical protein
MEKSRNASDSSTNSRRLMAADRRARLGVNIRDLRQ